MLAEVDFEVNRLSEGVKEGMEGIRGVLASPILQIEMKVLFHDMTENLR